MVSGKASCLWSQHLCNCVWFWECRPFGHWERLCVPISEQADSISFPLVQQLPLNLSQKSVGFNPYSINLVFCGNSLKILVVAVCGSRVLALLIVFFFFYTHRYFNKYVGEVVWDVASQTPFLHFNLKVWCWFVISYWWISCWFMTYGKSSFNLIFSFEWDFKCIFLMQINVNTQVIHQYFLIYDSIFFLVFLTKWIFLWFTW